MALCLQGGVAQAVSDLACMASQRRSIFTGDPVTVSIQIIDIRTDDLDRALHIFRTVSATACAIHIAGHRHADARVAWVAFLG
ncbi:hypothetical protein TW83_16675 [Paracoccus sp. S4493]|nr:hypothetical protein TW83_16675 [Paracoccus sp. S4493]